MTKRQQQILDLATATLYEEVEEAFKELAAAGLGPAYGLKLLRAAFGMPLLDAKKRVYFSAAWAHQREDIDRLHDLAESVAKEAATKK